MTQQIKWPDPREYITPEFLEIEKESMEKELEKDPNSPLSNIACNFYFLYLTIAEMRDEIVELKKEIVAKGKKSD